MTITIANPNAITFTIAIAIVITITHTIVIVIVITEKMLIFGHFIRESINSINCISFYYSQSYSFSFALSKYLFTLMLFC